MKKSYLYLVAAMALASCANDDYVGGENLASNDTTPIAFNMNTPATTRADQDGATAATTLGQEFIVWGEKAESDAATTSTNIVFENYRVQYVDGTANSTVSNTKGWEYVGIAPYANTKVSPAISTAAQTIKYWDFNKTYTFTAVSANKQDIADDKVKITKNYTNSTKLTHGYTIELTNGADASKIYVADRKEETRTTAPTAGNTVDPVTLKFRNFQTKIRFGFYETVPGYNVQITGVKYNNDTESTSNFGVDGDFVTAPTGTDKVTYTVTYDANNVPVVTVATEGTSAKATYKAFGGDVFQTGENYLSKEASAPTYDTTGGTYTCILPNTGNSTAMTFKVSYKLISEDTKEEIVVEDKQVTVPSQYCQWKPNFAYTYLFKVSDKSAELYPITFDAVVAEDEVNLQETITEVGEPSITTIAFDGTTVVTGKNEYEVGNTIYATTNATDGMTSTNTKLYTVTATAGTGATPVISEASVANCLAKMTESSGKWTATDATGGKLEVTKVETTDANFVTSVPSELVGGAARSINALKWTGTASTTYVVEYENSGTKYYKVVLVK
jgi:hypothetical protein